LRMLEVRGKGGSEVGFALHQSYVLAYVKS
jgi:hypothetical protein